MKDELQICFSFPEKGFNHVTVILDNPLHAGNGAGLQGGCEIIMADAQDKNERDDGHKNHTSQDESSRCCIRILFHYSRRTSGFMDNSSHGD